MTDIEIVRACALAMGIEIRWNDYLNLFQHGGPAPIDVRYYDPLHDDAQCMALLKRFAYTIDRQPEITGGGYYISMHHDGRQSHARDADLNRAVCLCVARMKP